jgi:Zn-dependent membrane protease YugP
VRSTTSLRVLRKPAFGVLDAKQRRAAARSVRLPNRAVGRTERLTSMIILGIILLIAGFVLKISILWTIGIIVLVIGVVLALLGAAGRAVGGRRHYF